MAAVFDVDFVSSAVVFDVGFEAVQIVTMSDLPVYNGAYTVVPNWSTQILPTREKQMTNDVKVVDIPYEFVSNPQGGITVTIGG